MVIDKENARGRSFWTDMGAEFVLARRGSRHSGACHGYPEHGPGPLVRNRHDPQITSDGRKTLRNIHETKSTLFGGLGRSGGIKPLAMILDGDCHVVACGIC